MKQISEGSKESQEFVFFDKLRRILALHDAITYLPYKYTSDLIASDTKESKNNHEILREISKQLVPMRDKLLADAITDYLEYNIPKKNG